MPDSLSRTFSKFICNLAYDDIPPEVVDKVKASLLHAAVVSLVGAETHHGKAAINLAKAEESNPAGATILADGSRASRCGAAFANSKLMHVTNQSDSYRMLIHPGPCVIPSALATAELGGNTGKEFLTAMAAAYEVEARIAGDFIPSTQARGFRSSPVYGTLGAAVATGKLLRLTEDQMVTAIALACTFTGGTTQGPSGGGQEMLYHEPNATRNGIMAALLAQEDVRGSEASLEGRCRILQRVHRQQPGRTVIRVPRPAPGVFPAPGWPHGRAGKTGRGSKPRRAFQRGCRVGLPVGVDARNPQDVPDGGLQLPGNRPDDPDPRPAPTGVQGRATHHR